MTQLERTNTGGLAPKGELGSLASLKHAPFLLLDTSSSMSAMLMGGELRRIDRLREVVANVRGQGVAFRQICFATEARETNTIPDPHGSTNMADAIGLAANKRASRIVIVSDGEPDNEESAIRAADAAGVPIDTFFCGDPDTRGEVFLKELSRLHKGRHQTVDLNQDPKALERGALLALTAGEEEAHGPIAL